MDTEIDKLVQAQDEPAGRHLLLEEGYMDVTLKAADSSGYLPSSDNTGSRGEPPAKRSRKVSQLDPASVTKMDGQGFPSMDPFAPLTGDSLPAKEGSQAGQEPDRELERQVAEDHEEAAIIDTVADSQGPQEGLEASAGRELDRQDAGTHEAAAHVARVEEAEADKGYESDTEADGGPATGSDVSLEGMQEGEPRGLKALDKEGWPDEDPAGGIPQDQPPFISWGISSIAPKPDGDTQVHQSRDSHS
eukprot:jgi/Botrbrau1/6080/Bobra.177_1s0019.2